VRGTTLAALHSNFYVFSMIYAANHCEAIDADHVNVESGVFVLVLLSIIIVNLFSFYSASFLLFVIV
jgi:hypothetical protein